MKFLVLLLSFGLLTACATISEPPFRKHRFPKNAHVSKVDRPYEVLGEVRGRIDYVTIASQKRPELLCKNYYNGAVRQMVKSAKAKGADAVVEVRSVVFLMNKRFELYSKPECYDDGAEGQVLTRGLAVRWVEPKKSDEALSQSGHLRREKRKRSAPPKKRL